MVFHCLMVSLCVFSGPIQAKEDEPSPSLMGTWQLVSAEYHGEKVSVEEIPVPRDEITFQNAGRGSWKAVTGFHEDATGKITGTFNTNPFTYKHWPDRKPKEIDIIITDGCDDVTTMKAIYRFEGDTLHFCAGSETRPKEFSTKKGTDAALFSFKRVKAKGK